MITIVGRFGGTRGREKKERDDGVNDIEVHCI
jgi:hypothetical protein